MIKFGVAGNSASFFEEGYKETASAANWCQKRGIDVFEYSFGRGVNLPSNTALAIGDKFKEAGVELTVHAPYFTNFSNTDEDMIKKSIGYVLQSVKKVKEFGGNRVVVHPASQGKLLRDEAHSVAMSNFKKLADTLDAAGIDDVKICIETMGKKGQMGTVPEVVDYCGIANVFYPCIDFGHINAREQGILKTSLNYNTIIAYLLDNLPKNKVFDMHVHFSKIMYGAKGELRHLTFEDEIYGPEFPPLAEVLKLYELEPYIICESSGTQAEDAVTMKKYYHSL